MFGDGEEHFHATERQTAHYSNFFIILVGLCPLQKTVLVIYVHEC